MDIYKVREEVLNVLNNIDALEEELKDIKERKYEGWEEDAEALEQQVDAYEDTIESLEWDLSEIVENIVKDIKNLGCMANAYANQKIEFAAKERWAKERIDREYDILQWILNSSGQKKVQTDLWKVSIQKNGGARGIAMTCLPENLPERFRSVKTEYSLNTVEARKALDAGEENLPFFYKPQGEHISIR